MSAEERNRCQGNRGIPQTAPFAVEDMPRKSLDIRFTDNPLVMRKKHLLLSLPPARTGLGVAQVSGQGTSPLQVLRAAP